MSFDDFAVLSNEDAVKIAFEKKIDDLEFIVPKMTLDQIRSFLAKLTPQYDPQWRHRLHVLLKGINEYSKLEAVGKILSAQQIQEIFDYAHQTAQNENWKLSPLLVGISHYAFMQFLRSASSIQMQYLKQEVFSEPLQHHLSVLTHQLLNEIPRDDELLIKLEKTIEQLDASTLNHQDLSIISGNLDQLRENFEQSIHIINKILALTWIANRADLIEKLSTAKESCQKQLDKVLGLPTGYDRPSVGLYAKLEKHLQGVFGNPYDPADIEAAIDDEPSLEALTKFSLWYLRDYWEVGLLPSIVDPEVLDRIAEQPIRDEDTDLRIVLLAQVRDNLVKLGLSTVKDLKKAGIFSKQLLIEHIARYRHLLMLPSR